MKNKSSYYKILHLTAEEGWLNHPEIVKEVQELGGLSQMDERPL